MAGKNRPSLRYHRLRRQEAAASPGSGTDEKSPLEPVSQEDNEAFWLLWAAHRKLVFRICLGRLSGRHAEAEDAASRVMEKARDILPREACDIQNPAAWLARMAANLCIDLQRGNQRRLQGASPGDFDHTPAAVILTDERCPRRRLIQNELARAIANAMAALPPRMRASARLFFVEGRSYAEISHMLRTSNANVRKRVQQARHLLKEMLKDHCL